ncbi:MAG: T9SS type A sorting domain-containing protein [Bacteroidetes bacterium]|nr:T9SS type A sorting domain-containing protein [Bacteroidota bacterium]
MRKNLLFLIILLCVSTINYGQTLVTPGDGTLTTAINAAADGDVLQLFGGAEYTVTDSSSFAKIIERSLTIEGDPSVTDKPIVKFASSLSEEPKFFLLGNNASFTLRSVIIDGNVNGVSKAANVISFDYNALSNDVSNIKNIRIENCEIKNTTDNVIHAMNSDMKYRVLIDSTYIDDCIMHNTGTIIMYKYAGSKFISVTNSTFYDILSYGMRITGTETSGFDETPITIVDHTTWNNIGTTDPREIILCEDGTAQPWTVTNNIFANQVAAPNAKTVVNIKEITGDVSTITNCAFWNISKVSWSNSTEGWAHVVTDTVTTDPQFVDAANGDFTIPAGNVLLSFSSTGGAVGDPRWAVNATSLERVEELPVEFALDQNYPNPFNPTTNIVFDIIQSENVTLNIYDILGREVSTLVNERLAAGSYRYEFDAKNLPSGIYIYTIQAGSKVASRKMILMK